MPRRRKSIHSNKAPLIFTESPVNKQSNVPSPVYCARHPLTAKSVPVEDLQDLSWVSPQFHNNIGSTRKVKKQRKRRSTSGPKCTCHCGSNSSLFQGKVQNNKFKPLKFMGDETPPVTIIEDVSFSDEDEEVENISQQSTSPCLNRSETCLNRKARPSRSSRKSSVNLRNKHFSDADQSDSKQTENLDQTVDNFCIGNMSVHTPVTNLVSKDMHAVVVQNETFSQFDDIPNEPSDVTHTPVNKITSPVKRLFTSLNNSPETNVFTLIKNRKSLKRDKKLKNRLLTNLCTSTCSSPVRSHDQVHVLVADTPEAEYGIPYRLRTLRHKKKEDSF